MKVNLYSPAQATCGEGCRHSRRSIAFRLRPVEASSSFYKCCFLTTHLRRARHCEYELLHPRG